MVETLVMLHNLCSFEHPYKSGRPSLYENLFLDFIFILFRSDSKIVYTEKTFVISWMDF